MTKKEIEVLAQACRAAGVDTTKIKPENPFEKSGATATFIQGAVEQIDPVMAAKWRVAAGGGLSLATMAELQSGQALSEAAQKDLFQHDPEYVKEVVAQRQNAEEQLLKQMEERTAEMRFQNTLRRAGGNEHAARRMIEAEDQQNARHQQQLHVMRGGN